MRNKGVSFTPGGIALNKNRRTVVQGWRGVYEKGNCCFMSDNAIASVDLLR